MTDKPTLADLLALPAGRELDAEIATLRGQRVAWIKGQCYVIDPDYPAQPVPHVSKAIVDAWPLLAEMLAGGVIIYIVKVADGILLQWCPSNAAEWHSTVAPALTDAPAAIVRAWATWKLGGERQWLVN